MLLPTVLLDKVGPKHSTSVPSSVAVAVPLSVDEKEVAFVASNLAVKTAPGPPSSVSPVLLCNRWSTWLSPTRQMVTPVLSPATVHLKVKVSFGQVGGAAVNCPPASTWR